MDRQNLNHFIDLAKRGKDGHASSGEIAARKLAEIMVECTSVLDDRALNGAKLFMTVAWVKPQTAREAIR